MITLSSDFGWPYPAAMRGVLLTHAPDTTIVDITHGFPRGEVRTAGFWLREVLPYFPPAVHLAVIDPGVGTDRAVLVIEAGEHKLIGPDNGVLQPAATALSSDWTAYELVDHEAASNTFHGRDVFAPLAAQVHQHGIAQLRDANMIQPAERIESMTFPEADVSDEQANGEILVVDGFGNAITNIPGDFLTESLGTHVEINGQSVMAASSYAHVERGDPLVTVGSHGNVEVAVNGGRGDGWFGLYPGTTVRINRYVSG